MSEPWLRIHLLADEDAPFTVMFEPTGMTTTSVPGRGCLPTFRD